MNMQKLLKDRLDHVPLTSGDEPEGSKGSSKRGRDTSAATETKADSKTNTGPSGSVTQEAAS